MVTVTETMDFVTDNVLLSFVVGLYVLGLNLLSELAHSSLPGKDQIGIINEFSKKNGFN